MSTKTAVSVNGLTIQIDRSGGHGHCWRDCDSIDCPPSVQEEIAAEIIDGRGGQVIYYVASNGQHYRWR
jgi:hypothetical protein